VERNNLTFYKNDGQYDPMNKFTYNNNGGKKIDNFPVVIFTENILEADIKFQAQTGIDPVKNPWVGCSIEFNVDIEVKKEFDNLAG
jgi:hypothetical protein